MKNCKILREHCALSTNTLQTKMVDQRENVSISFYNALAFDLLEPVPALNPHMM